MNYHQNRKFEKNIKNVALENKTNLKSNCDGDLKIPAQYSMSIFIWVIWREKTAYEYCV